MISTSDEAVVQQIEIRPILQGINLATDMIRAIQAATGLQVRGQTMNTAAISLHLSLHRKFGDDFLRPSIEEQEYASESPSLSPVPRGSRISRHLFRTGLALGIIASSSTQRKH